MDFNFQNGNIIYDNFCFDVSKKIECQEDSLVEDLLQVSFPDNLLLDLGWYPEFDITGQFVLQIIRNYDWDIPLYKREFSNLCMVYKELSDALKYIGSVCTRE